MAFSATTWSPTDKDSGLVLSDGNSTAESSFGGVRSTLGVSSGKHYWEITFPSGISDAASPFLGVATPSANLGGYFSSAGGTWTAKLSTGGCSPYADGSAVTNSSFGAVATTLGVLLDTDSLRIGFSADGTVNPVWFPLDDGRWTEQTASGSHDWYSVACSSDGTKIAAVGQGYIYTSTDGGGTWTERTGAGSGDWGGIACSSDGSAMVAVDWGGYIHTSADGGDTWTERTAAGLMDWNGVACSSDGTRIAASVYGGYIHTSVDGGDTWTEQTASGSHDWSSVACSSDGTKLAAAVNGGYIYTSTDGGGTWTEQTGAGGQNWNSVACSSDGLTLYASATGGGYVSSDGGATWSALAHDSAGVVAISGDGTKLACSDGTSEDGGATWLVRTGYKGASPAAIAMSSDGTKIVFCATGGNIYTSDEVAALSGGTYHAVYGCDGPNAAKVTANFGAATFIHAPPAGFTAGLGTEAAGSPQEAQAEGVAAFAAGVPTALPYIDRVALHQGAACFAAGYPSATYNPVATEDKIALAVGTAVFAAGTPTAGSSALATADGALAFGAGAPTVARAARASGLAAFAAGAPRAGAVARCASAPAFGSGTATVRVVVAAHGRLLTRCGTPRAIPSAADAGLVEGVAAFGAGTPGVSGMAAYARPAAAFCAGTPSMAGEATC